ncbi:MAG: putative sulfate exporter family transporter [Candidatus Velthaea sp.]
MNSVATQRLSEKRPLRLIPLIAKNDSPIPGLALVLAVAVVARLLSRCTGAFPDVAIALVAGMLLRNLVGLPAGINPGIAFTLRYLLRAAIILFGAGLTFAAIAHAGAATLALVGLCFIMAMGLGLALARAFRLPGVVGLLIGAGTAICGGSAILALGPLVRAKDEEIAYAISTIFTFNVIALLLYPPLGHLFHFSQIAFGSWSGTAVNDTSVVVATGYIYGAKAGAVATIVKLTRTMLLVPLAIVVGLRGDAQASNGARAGAPLADAGIWRRVTRTIPWFIFGFVAMAALNSVGAFSVDTARVLTATAAFFIVMVLAGVGLNVDVAQIGRLGLRPLAVGILLATVMAGVSIGLIRALRIG